MVWLPLALLVLLIAASVALSLLRLAVWAAIRVGWRPAKPAYWVEQPRVWVPAAAVLAFLSLLGGWAAGIEPGWIEVVRLEIPTDRPVCGRPRFRIVHLSDLHLEEIGARERRLLEIVREEKPDLVLLTGDLLNDRDLQDELVTLLAELRAPFGLYGVEGRWDTRFPVAGLYAAAGGQLLRDDHARVAAAEGRELLLVGLGLHPHRSVAEILEGAAPGSFKVLLHHEPDAAGQPVEAPVDLFLCGGSHGGQVRLPLLGPLVDRGWRWDAGTQRAGPGGPWVHVNRGLGLFGGTVPRIRFLCRPEVAVIDLVAD